MLIEINHERIRQIINENQLVLIDFYMQSDTLSDMLYNVMMQVQRNLENHIIIATCNIDEEEKVKEQMGIKDLPAVILYKNGHEVAKMTGFRRAATIIEMVNEHDV